MSDMVEDGLKHQEFWSRMAKNSLVVQRMPGWMKGSPVNRRIQIPARITEKAISVKAASRPSR